MALFNRSQVESIVLGESDEWLVALSNDKDIGQPSGEHFAISILEVDNIKAALMPVSVEDDAYPADIVASGDIGYIAYLQLGLFQHLASGQV